MSLERLIDIMKPPSEPTATGIRESWQTVENNIVPLPSDYKSFIDIYGVGIIDEFILVFNPFAGSPHLNLGEMIKVINEAYTQSKREFPEYFKHEVFPHPGGLLPWAQTENGDELYWLTLGESDNWTTVVYASRSGDFLEYPLSMTGFLYEVLSGNMVCEIFPDDFPSKSPEYSLLDME